MEGVLKLEISSFSNLEEHGKKEDGTPDIRRNSGYKIRLVINNQFVLFEQTLNRNKLPVNATRYLVGRISDLLSTYLPQIDPE